MKAAKVVLGIVLTIFLLTILFDFLPIIVGWIFQFLVHGFFYLLSIAVGGAIIWGVISLFKKHH